MATVKDVKAAFRVLETYLPDVSDGWRYHLETWSPGDGATRYRVTLENMNGGSHHPFGGRWWLGASEAQRGIWDIQSGIMADDSVVGILERFAESA